jgi:hypothetical protein
VTFDGDNGTLVLGSDAPGGAIKAEHPGRTGLDEPVGPITRAKRTVFARGNRSLVARAKRKTKRPLTRQA